MPAIRMSQYGQHVEIYCAPTADDRLSWIPSMQHIAMEGRCYVLSAVQYITLGEYGENYRSRIGSKPEDVLLRGGSAIIDPLGEIIAGPVYDKAAIIEAELDRDTLMRSRFDFDPVGHYARPDLFSLQVDRAPKPAVRFFGIEEREERKPDSVSGRRESTPKLAKAAGRG